ncbi:MAG: hypothetical protein ACHRHE_10620 [Tepidisphaerales bacterium]
MFAIVLLFALVIGAWSCVYAAESPTTRPTTQPANRGPELTVAFPLKKPLMIAYKDLGFTVLSNKLDDDGASRDYQAYSGGTASRVRVHMERGEKAGDTAARVRDVYWAETKKQDVQENIKDEKFVDIGEFAAVEYTVAVGSRTSIKGYALFSAREGVWLDIRLEKVIFAEKDRDTLESLARSVRVAPALP